MVGLGCGKDGAMLNMRVKYKALSARISWRFWRSHS